MLSIPVRIHPFFWLLAAFIGWFSSHSFIGTIVWMVVILISILFHEYGHAITARFFGQDATITLMGFGGVTQRSGQKLNYWKEFLIVAAGPLFGFGLCGIAFALFVLIENRQDAALLQSTLLIMVWVNLFWTIINLLPVHPLDGGKLLGIALEGFLGFKGLKAAHLISFIFCVSVTIVFFAIGWFFPAILFTFLTFENYRAWKTMMAMSVYDQDYSLWEQLRSAEGAIKENRLQEAYEGLLHIRDIAKKGVIYIASTQYLSDVLDQLGRTNEAYQLLFSVKDKINPDYLCSLHRLAFRSGHYQEAIELGNEAYREAPNPETALTNALAHAKIGDAKPAIGWLECALRDGMPNFSDVLKDENFDSIRHDAGFQALVEAQN